MDRETYDITARAIYLGLAEPRELSDWAIAQLERGKDGKNLEILASELTATSVNDLRERLIAAIVEIWESLPDEETAVRKYSDSVMQSIVDGDIAPYEGASIFHNFPSEFDFTYDYLYWAHEEMRAQDYDAFVINEARQRLNGEETELMRNPCKIYEEPAPQPTLWQRIKTIFGG